MVRTALSEGRYVVVPIQIEIKMTRSRIIIWILMAACTLANAILVAQSIWTTTLRGAGLAQADLGIVLSLILYGTPALLILLGSLIHSCITTPEPRKLLFQLTLHSVLGFVWVANFVALLGVIVFVALVVQYGFFWLF